MFFKREAAHVPTFGERLKQLEKLGFSVTQEAGGGTRVEREGCAVVLAPEGDTVRLAARPGLAMGHEIGALIDGGFQKFFRAASGAKKPALASELTALYNFQQDLKEGLGQVSLYNEALGTTSAFYLYDRVEDRDHGVPKRVWE